MPARFTPSWRRQARSRNVSEAAELAQVTRTTIYAWMRKHEVHCVHRPSGRHFICALSLLVNEEFDGDHGSQPRAHPLHPQLSPRPRRQ